MNDFGNRGDVARRCSIVLVSNSEDTANQLDTYDWSVVWSTLTIDIDLNVLRVRNLVNASTQLYEA